jgi:hypothetical protein
MTNLPHSESLLSPAQQRRAPNSNVTHANTNPVRPFISGLDEAKNNFKSHHNSAPDLELSLLDMQNLSGKPTAPVAQEQKTMPAQNVRRAGIPLHNSMSAWNSNEQTASQKSVYPFESTAIELQRGKPVQQSGDQLQRTEPLHKYSGHPSERSVQAELTEHPKSLENDDQEDIPEQHLANIQQNGLGSTHIPTSQAAGASEAINPQGISIPNHRPSRAPSEVPSRPQSRRSNCGIAITRPISAQDLRPQGVFEAASQRGIHSMKIKKSGNAPPNPFPSEASVKSAIVSGQQRQDSGSRPKFFQKYKAFLASGEQLLEIIEDYEQQSQLVVTQKTEIEKLRNVSDSAINQVRALETEKAGLTAKLKKFAELSSKYKKHINDVIMAQKYLKSQAQEIQKSTKEAIESTKIAAKTHATIQKFVTAVEDAKRIRVSEEKFAQGTSFLSCYRQLLIIVATKQNQDLEAANQELRDETQKIQKGAQELRDEVQKLRDDNEQLTNDNKKLQIDFGAGLHCTLDCFPFRWRLTFWQLQRIASYFRLLSIGT